MATKLTPEAARLKAYLKEHFDFPVLKKAGLFGADIKHTDYEAQAARLCARLGLSNIYEYAREVARITGETDTCVSGKMPDVVTASGVLLRGGGFLLSVVPAPKRLPFACPACTCPGTVTARPDPSGFSLVAPASVACKGCKRKLRPRLSDGELLVTEA